MFTLPDLPYPAESLEPYIDKETMLVHHDKHHATYVKNLNDAMADLPDLQTKTAEELLKNLDIIPELVRPRIKNNAGGVLNHTLFWNWMTPQKNSPSELLLKKINSGFGSLDTLKEKLLSQALNQFGSGWAWLILDRDNLSIISTPNQDSPVSQNLKPILGVDVWEHAYYLKYQNRRMDYLQAWWNVINWDEVNRLLTF